MKRRDVIVLPEAERDLIQIRDYVKDQAGRDIANRYVDRIATFLSGLSHTSERGTLRSDVRPGLRIVGFERRLTVAFTVRDDRVYVLRIFTGGQNWHDAMKG